MVSVKSSLVILRESREYISVRMRFAYIVSGYLLGLVCKKIQMFVKPNHMKRKLVFHKNAGKQQYRH